MNMESPDYTIDRQLAQELVDKIQMMVKDRDKKLNMAKEQLIEQLKVTADKYRTGTGVMESLRIMRLVNDGRPADMAIFEEVEQARNLAANMVVNISRLVDKAEKLGHAEMNELCNGEYDTDFISKGFSAMELCEELMKLDLCRNIGPAAEDMVLFLEKTSDELESTNDELEKLCEEHPEFRDLEPTPKED